MSGDADSAPTTTGMSYFLPLPSTTLVNRNARRLSSGSTPWNCQRTRGCNSASLSIGRSMRTTSPSASSAARCCWKSSAGPAELPAGRRLSGWSSIGGSRRLLRVVLLPLGDDRTGVAEAVHADRDAAVDRDLREHGADFVRRHAVVERAPHVGLELLHAAERSDHAEIEDRALARRQCVVAPGLAPAILRDDALEVAVEVVRAGHGLVDIAVARHFAAHFHPDVVDFLV